MKRGQCLDRSRRDDRLGPLPPDDGMGRRRARRRTITITTKGDKTTGPYGFVKDTRGSVVADATVTVDIKNRGQLVTQTNILGAYRIPTFGIAINPDDVTISCKKEGYKQVSVMHRLGMADPKAGFEVECTLQKQ